MENRRGSEIFLGVIGIATLVVAIIGATFAFFSASTNSAADAVTAGSTTVALNYTDTVGTNLKSALIPARDRIATYAALDQDGTNNTNAQCVDDNGNDVCGVYQFTVSNPSTTTTQNISFKIEVALNTFANLHYKIYSGTASDLTSGSLDGTTTPESTVLATGTFPAVASGGAHQEVDLAGLNTQLGVSTANNASATYTLVLWIHEIDPDDSTIGNAQGDQTTADSGKSFAAQMHVTSGGGAGVTGVIAASGVTNS